MANGLNLQTDYKYGFSVPQKPVFRAKKGLSAQIVEEISYLKGEPVWMRQKRLRALEIFLAKKMPMWGADLSEINFDEIYYYIKPTSKKSKTWEEVPAEIKYTFERLGIPEAERKFLAGVELQFDSETVYGSIKKKWEEKGVIFCDTDAALKKYGEIVQKYFGTIIPAADNKFAALNSAVWSGGSFVWVPAGVKVDIPLQAYFRINANRMGQFERTLIIAEEGSEVCYIEGCTSPTYTTDSLHAAVVEIIVKPGAKVQYITVQNWSSNVYNLVTKRAFVQEEGEMLWIDANLGCLTGDTKVFTNPKGPVPITQLQKGDYIYAFDLNSLKTVRAEVNGLIFSGVKQTYKIVTTDFREITATGNHPFLHLRKVSNLGIQYLEWKPLSQLKPGDWIAVCQALPDDGKNYLINYNYPLPKRGRVKTQISIPTESSKDLMWLLGLYLGDGCIERDKMNRRARRVNFAVPPQDRARKKLEDLLFKTFRVKGKQHRDTTLRINSSVLADLILSLGFDGTAKSKKIPGWVWGLPLQQRLAFIEGYIEADGHIRQAKFKNGIQFGQIVLASANKELLEEIKLLMISCGLKPLKISTYSKERTLWKNSKVYTSHYLSLNIRDNLDLIRGKNINLKDSIYFTRIKEITIQKKEKVYDIEVESVHNFIANGIVVHNSKVTMKYPSFYLMGPKAAGETLSLAVAGAGQHQDAGSKAFHLAPETSSIITSKSVSFNGGRTSYRGLVKVINKAEKSKSHVVCDALILDEKSRSDTYPTMEIDEDNVSIAHEASIAKISGEQLFYLQSRGLTEDEARSAIVNGFISPIVKQIPLEYAVELNRLIQLEMEGAVG